MRYKIFALLLFISLYIQGAEPFYFSKLSLEHGLSQITVTSIYQDSKGFMWFGTRNGLNRFDGYQFNVYANEVENAQSISDNHILCITEDKEGYLWIGTNSGLNKYNPVSNTFERYLTGNMILSLYYNDSGLWIGTPKGLSKYNPENNSCEQIPDFCLENDAVNVIIGYKENLYLGTNSKGVIIYTPANNECVSYKEISGSFGTIALNDVRALFIDNNESLWIGTHHEGLCVLKKDKQSVLINQRSGLSNDFIRCINQSPEGNILVGTFNGLSIIDPATYSISQHKTSDSQNGNISHYSIYSIYYDKAKTLWIGTYAGGVNYYNPYARKFRFYDPGMDLKGVIGIIGPMVEYGNSIFIASEGGGLIEKDKQSDSYKQYKLSDNKDATYAQNILKSLYLDGDRILCGTNMGTIYSFDLKTKRYTLFHDFKMGNTIYQIGRNSAGELFAAGVNNIGLTFFRNGEIKSKFAVAGKADFSFYNIRCVLETEKGIYLIGTRNDGLYYYNSKLNELIQYKHQPTDKNSLPENYVSSIFKDSTGQIWIGTFGGGLSLFDPESKQFKTYNTKDGLQNNNICAIAEDSNRHLWISTISGISDFDLQSKEFKNYTHSSGIEVNEFTPHANLQASDGRIFFSGNNGFISFDPRRMNTNPYIPSIVLRELYVNNARVVPGDGILKEPLEMQKEIVLKYNEANISIEYSALNYVFSERNQYAYKLEGFDEDWVPAGTRRMAYYTNIPSGKYKFIVKGSNNDGIWNNDGVSILITVLPPLWKTWWAYCIYALLLTGISILIFRYYNERKRLENDIKLEQAKADAQEEFHQARTRLFTNFSHELRTPLTLIMSPLGDMIEKGKDLPEKVQDNHRLMYSNTLRMLRLVNNLMDFQKKESGTMKLRLEKDDFIQFSGEMVSLFNELATSRHIDLKFNSAVESLDYIFDKSLMEKVYFNFLSNAFKNVPDNGRINVNLKVSDLKEIKENWPQKASGFTNNNISYLLLEIKDTGVGIPQDQWDDIFTPFYQVAQNKHSSSGTGLGLSLSKSIIEMHKGVVWAESREGAIFRCIFPIDSDFVPEQSLEIPTEENRLLHKVEVTENTNDESVSHPKGKYTVLVVEDNQDVRNYIVSNLSSIYNIITAADGAEAVDKAISQLPDLIVSDLMMPKMDGMEMCSILKKDLRTSHIPIIMLTARAMSSDMKEGYETGADDYITKPFDSSVLIARVGNIIQAREKLKEIYGKKFSLQTLGVEASSSIDEQFMQKLYKVLEENVSNPEFNLDSFSKDIGMSRASLYRKIKSVTDLSPNEFIRNFRLEMGAKLLRETKLSVSEVYVSVGFNSIAYFSTCFKAHYGISPTEYASQALDS